MRANILYIYTDDSNEVSSVRNTELVHPKKNFLQPNHSDSMATPNNTFVDRIDPFAKRSLRKNKKRSQGSSRYHQNNEADLAPLPLFKGKLF
jgi:hypothetical protein